MAPIFHFHTLSPHEKIAFSHDTENYVGQLKRIVINILVGCSIALVVYCVSQTIAYYPFLFIQNCIDDSLSSRRWSLKNSSSQHNNQIAIVDIDDRSIAELGDFNQFPRRFFGKVIGRLKDNGARLIFLDIFLSEGGEFNDNMGLADSLKSAGNVCCGFYLNLDNNSKKKYPVSSILNDCFNFWEYKTDTKVDFLQSNHVVFSFHELIMSADSVGVGFTNYVPDSDGIVRHIPLFIAHKRLLVPSASLQLWLYLHGFNCSEADISPRGVRFGNIFIPADRHCFMRINYQTSQESYSYVSFADVLDNNYRQGTFGNKIVMIGSSSKKLNDLKKIPGNRYIPGVEVHAAALSTILNELFIKVLPGHVIFIITVLSGIFARFVFSLFHPVKVGLPFAIGIPILLYLAAMYSYIYRLQLVNIIIPISVTLALYAITVIQYYFRIRRMTET